MLLTEQFLLIGIGLQSLDISCHNMAVNALQCIQEEHSNDLNSGKSAASLLKLEMLLGLKYANHWRTNTFSEPLPFVDSVSFMRYSSATATVGAALRCVDHEVVVFNHHAYVRSLVLKVANESHCIEDLRVLEHNLAEALRSTPLETTTRFKYFLI